MKYTNRLPLVLCICLLDSQIAIDFSKGQQYNFDAPTTDPSLIGDFYHIALAESKCLQYQTRNLVFDSSMSDLWNIIVNYSQTTSNVEKLQEIGTSPLASIFLDSSVNDSLTIWSWDVRYVGFSFPMLRRYFTELDKYHYDLLNFPIESHVRDAHRKLQNYVNNLTASNADAMTLVNNLRTLQKDINAAYLQSIRNNSLKFTYRYHMIENLTVGESKTSIVAYNILDRDTENWSTGDYNTKLNKKYDLLRSLSKLNGKLAAGAYYEVSAQSVIDPTANYAAADRDIMRNYNQLVASLTNLLGPREPYNNLTETLTSTQQTELKKAFRTAIPTWEAYGLKRSAALTTTLRWRQGSLWYDTPTPTRTAAPVVGGSSGERVCVSYYTLYVMFIVYVLLF